VNIKAANYNNLSRLSVKIDLFTGVPKIVDFLYWVYQNHSYLC